MNAAADRFITTLRDISGPTGVVDDPELTTRYRWDWTGRFGTDAPVTVARPGTADEVAAIVEVCAERQVAIVPQGGNTSLVGGSVPVAGELVLSTERLSGIGSVDATTGSLTAGAGTPLAVVQQAAARAGWRYGVDIASRDSATIGGTVATNAGGLHVLRYGTTRAQVTGVAFVDGTAARHGMSRATLRDNTGYDLPSLLCGSEGTLGVITAVRVRLVPEFTFRTAALLRFANPRDAAVAVEALRGVLPSVESAEFFFAPGLELVCATFSYPPPFVETVGGYVLVEVADTDDRTAALGAAVESLSGVSDVAVADDPAGLARLWRYRERHTEAIATVGVPHKLDVAVPPGSLAEFVARVTNVVGAVDPDARVWLFGHGGEASVHVNVTGPADDDDAVDDAVLALVVDMGGSISAEHGIGTAKRAWIDRIQDEPERRLRARLRDAFDPHRILNPGVLTGSR
ncbi:MAG TPA: FAD-binding oxidoreductase [Acidimicrobiales bacterium]|nr:FAD-binding oxidoreductase [Acidimicrobiales bacterium]